MPDGRQAERALQSVADTAVGSQTFPGSFNISGVIAVIVQSLQQKSLFESDAGPLSS